jgi:hypothetical protein
MMMTTLVAKGLAPKTLGADRKYSDGDDLVLQCSAMGITPHFAVRDDRPSALARLCHDDRDIQSASGVECVSRRYSDS